MTVALSCITHPCVTKNTLPEVNQGIYKTIFFQNKGNEELNSLHVKKQLGLEHTYTISECNSVEV